MGDPKQKRRSSSDGGTNYLSCPGRLCATGDGSLTALGIKRPPGASYVCCHLGGERTDRWRSM